MTKGLIATIHALGVTLLSYGLMYVEVAENPFWVVVFLGITWFAWVPMLLKQNRWFSLITSLILISPSTILVYKLLGVAYG